LLAAQHSAAGNKREVYFVFSFCSLHPFVLMIVCLRTVSHIRRAFTSLYLNVSQFFVFVKMK